METVAHGASALMRTELRLGPALRLCHANAGSYLARITVSGNPQMLTPSRQGKSQQQTMMKCLCPMVHLNSSPHSDGFGCQECFCMGRILNLWCNRYCCQFISATDLMWSKNKPCREPLFLEIDLLDLLYRDSQMMQGRALDLNVTTTQKGRILSTHYLFPIVQPGSKSVGVLP